MDDKLDPSLLDSLFYNLGARSALAGTRISMACDDGSQFWSEADDDLFYFANMKDLYSFSDEVKLFVYADYLTYIPYGDLGYALAEEKIRDKYGISLAQWRYELFLKIIGDNGAKLFNGAQLARIQKFFENRDLKEVHFGDLDEATAALMRLRHCAEATIRDHATLNAFDEIWPDALNTFTDELSENDSLPMEKILAIIPSSPLGDMDKAFLEAALNRLENI